MAGLNDSDKFLSLLSIPLALSLKERLARMEVKLEEQQQQQQQ